MFALGVAAAFLLLTDLESLARHVDGRLLAAVLVAQGPLLLSVEFVAQRHAILLRDPPVPLVLAFKSIVLALGLNLVVPGRLSDLVKASYMRQHADIPMSTGLAAVFVERLLDVVALGFFGLLAAIGSVLGVDWTLYTVVAAAAIAVIVALPMMERLATWAIGGRTGRLARFVMGMARAATRQVRGPGFVKAGLAGFVGWGCTFAGTIVFFEVQSVVALDVPQIAAIFVVVILAGALPVLPAGLGTFEAAGVFVLTQFGATVPEALTLTIALHLTYLLGVAALFPFVLARDRTGIGSLLRAGRDSLRESAEARG